MLCRLNGVQLIGSDAHSGLREAASGFPVGRMAALSVPSSAECRTIRAEAGDEAGVAADIRNIFEAPDDRAEADRLLDETIKTSEKKRT